MLGPSSCAPSPGGRRKVRGVNGLSPIYARPGRRVEPAIAAVAAALAITVVGDAIPASLTGAKGDPARGRGIVVDRNVGLCLLCHRGPFPEVRIQTDIGPDLTGTGARLSEGQIRLRIVDPGRVNAASIMPAYYRTEGLTRVAPAFRGKPLLTAEQIEDVVAYLVTLR
ncbi:MAG: sulfur oxidation c-type cytochrome SoxX [Betaproteobacteria bacterium]|nr:sulfur oxidation c-type cytochrome SoxX [Betaproteobacteria bacterium]